MKHPRPFQIPDTLYSVLVIGAPGAGKGTLAQAIMGEMSRVGSPCSHISTGDLLRQLPLDDPRAVELQALVAAGKFVSDDTMYELLSERLAEHRHGACLIDGMPRTLPQAQWMMRAVRPKLAIVLHVPDEVLISRIAGRRTHLPSGRVYNVNDPNFGPAHAGVDDQTGEPLSVRPEDTSDRARERLALYAERTKPVVNYLETAFAAEKTPVVLWVDGTRSTGEILPTVLPWVAGQLSVH